MPLERNETILLEFMGLCEKYSSYDGVYADTQHQDGVFTNQAIERAYTVFRYIRTADEDSNLKKTFNFWREYHYGESRRIGILFAYIHALESEYISNIWENRWDAKARNIDLEHEFICRIFILGGITAKQKFESTGVLV